MIQLTITLPNKDYLISLMITSLEIECTMVFYVTFLFSGEI